MTKDLIEIDNKFYQKAKVVMLATDKAEGALIKDNGKHTDYCMKTYNPKAYYTQEYLESINCSSFHLYIISDEKPKECDWFIANQAPRFCIRVDENEMSCPFVTLQNGEEVKHFHTWRSKVIATTNPELTKASKSYPFISSDFYGLPRPSNSFIEAFVREWNKGNKIEEVLIEVEIEKLVTCKPCGGSGKFKSFGDSSYSIRQCEYCEGDGLVKKPSKVKVAPDNTITIKQVPKVKNSWSREEIKDLFINYYNDNILPTILASEFHEHEHNEWMENNLK